MVINLEQEKLKNSYKKKSKYISYFIGDIPAAEEQLKVHKVDMETNDGSTALTFAAENGTL